MLRRCLVILALALAAACSEQPYWTKTHEPIKVTGVHYVSDLSHCDPLGRAWGCIVHDYKIGIVYIASWSPKDQQECVLAHEVEGHAAGFSHPTGPHFSPTPGTEWMDCGPNRPKLRVR